MITVKNNHIATPGPNLSAVPAWGPSVGRRLGLFSNKECARLANSATIVRFTKGLTIYRERQDTDAVFVIVTGVVKAYKAIPAGSQRIAAFLFPDDVFGLSEEGKYTNSAKAVTSVTAYRIPASALKRLLFQDASIGFHVICKLCDELRGMERHAFLVSRRGALGRLAMFLQMIERYEGCNASGTGEVYLPMSRSDIGEYVALSPEVVSRSFRRLATLGLIGMRDKRHVKILDRVQFDELVRQAP
jgi:CRP-like cAMP-binding protein